MKSPAEKTHQGAPNTAMRLLTSLPVIVGIAVRWTLGLFLGTIFLYQAVASPPLHLWFPVREAAGPSSIYVPGESCHWYPCNSSIINALVDSRLTNFSHLLFISFLGSGFSGVWFHLGFLQALPSIHNHDFYCYSSGCLSTYHSVPEL